MGTFNTGEDLHVDHLNIPTKDKPWVLTSMVSWTSNDGVTINVPIGYRTDLFSVPRRLMGFKYMDTSGVGVLASVVHDYLCDTKGKYDADKDRVGSVKAARYFREGMRDLGVGKKAVKLKYLGVRIAGPRF